MTAKFIAGSRRIHNQDGYRNKDHSGMAMKPAPAIAMVAAITALTCACASGAELPSTIASAPGAPVRISYVHAYAGSKGISVYGQVLRRNADYGAHGDLLVTIEPQPGKPARRRCVGWGTMRKRWASSSFSVYFKGSRAEDVRSVVVRFEPRCSAGDERQGP